VRAADPEVARAGDRSLRQQRNGVGPLVFFRRDRQVVEFLRIEAGQRKIEVGLAQFLEFQGQEFLIPRSPRDGSIHHEPERLDLSFSPLVTRDHENTGRVAARPPAQPVRGFQPQVAIHYGPIAASKCRHL
jgi:hypothetical protein